MALDNIETTEPIEVSLTDRIKKHYTISKIILLCLILAPLLLAGGIMLFEKIYCSSYNCDFFGLLPLLIIMYISKYLLVIVLPLLLITILILIKLKYNKKENELDNIGASYSINKLRIRNALIVNIITLLFLSWGLVVGIVNQIDRQEIQKEVERRDTLDDKGNRIIATITNGTNNDVCDNLMDSYDEPYTKCVSKLINIKKDINICDKLGTGVASFKDDEGFTQNSKIARNHQCALNVLYHNKDFSINLCSGLMPISGEVFMKSDLDKYGYEHTGEYSSINSYCIETIQSYRNRLVLDNIEDYKTAKDCKAIDKDLYSGAYDVCIQNIVKLNETASNQNQNNTIEEKEISIEAADEKKIIISDLSSASALLQYKFEEGVDGLPTNKGNCYSPVPGSLFAILGDMLTTQIENIKKHGNEVKCISNNMGYTLQTRSLYSQKYYCIDANSKFIYSTNAPAHIEPVLLDQWSTKSECR